MRCTATCGAVIRSLRTSEEEIALRERKNGGGLACDEPPVDVHLKEAKAEYAKLQ